ncbi:MAG: hypothetical protein HDR46_04930 [Bacteroides sp.]|nr:hypothetical protein [Bacteroides sp.]
MDKQAILNGSYFSLDEKSGMKFRLVDRNWNDYGYYTLYALEFRLPNSDIHYRIADIRIMNIGQPKGSKPTWIPTTPIAFISNIESAEKLLIFLTHEQRNYLEKALLISYDTKHIEKEPVFIYSVNRDKALHEFIERQESIKKIMQSQLEISSMIDNHKTQIIQLFAETNITK